MAHMRIEDDIFLTDAYTILGGGGVDFNSVPPIGDFNSARPPLVTKHI